MDKKELKELMARATEEEKYSPGRPPFNPPKSPAKDTKTTTEEADKLPQVSVHLTIPKQAELVMAGLAKAPSIGFVVCGDRAHRLVHREGVVLYEAHTRDSLRGHIARHLRFEKRDKERNWQPCNPSKELVDDLLALPDYPKSIPRVRWIKSTPLLTAEGNLISTSGLYPEHETYLQLDPALEGMQLPAEADLERLQREGSRLLAPFRDFPVEPDSVAPLLALLFTMLFREWISGVTPMFIVDANTKGSGKGLLISALSVIAFGREMDFSPGNVSSDELRKRLFAVAAQGAPMHVLDNIEKTVFSPELAAWLTAPRYTDRKLGESTVCTYPNTLIVIGTGNNVEFGGDIPRRVALIRLKSTHPRPEERSGFHYADLLEHLRLNRRKLLRSAYTIMAAWLRQGRPVPEDRDMMGSFQPWADFGSGILHILDAKGLLDNRVHLRARDRDEDEFETMLLRAQQVFGDGEFTAKELWEKLDPEDVPAVLSQARLHHTKSMGRLLTRIEGRAMGESHLFVRHVRTMEKTKLYRIEHASLTADGKGESS